LISVPYARRRWAAPDSSCGAPLRIIASNRTQEHTVAKNTRAGTSMGEGPLEVGPTAGARRRP
jgi:hypothetical protein